MTPAAPPEKPICCPVCGSHNTRDVNDTKIVSLEDRAPNWHCNDCYCRWNESRRAHPAMDEREVDIARFEHAPCYLCGYNGEGYYHPEYHKCAEKYHQAVFARAKLGKP